MLTDMKYGLSKIYPDRNDYSLLHTYGALNFDTQGLPTSFSIYDGRPIPNQNTFDTRFIPAIRPLPWGCVGETTTFAAGLEDGAVYPPDDFYFAIPPGTDGQGRDIREGLQTAIDRGFKLPDGTIGAKRTAYFNCYGAGAIDDFDAVRIALWINQVEKRGVSIGSYFYPEFVMPAPGSGAATSHPDASGIVPVPSFNTAQASLHNWLITGWKTVNGVIYLEALTWQGQFVEYFTREIFNALMAQPYTGAFTITKVTSQTPVPIGFQAYIDHLVYFVRNLFHITNAGRYLQRG